MGLRNQGECLLHQGEETVGHGSVLRPGVPRRGLLRAWPSHPLPMSSVTGAHWCDMQRDTWLHVLGDLYNLGDP